MALVIASRKRDGRGVRRPEPAARNGALASVLDRTADTDAAAESTAAEDTAAAATPAWRRLWRPAQRAGQYFVALTFSSLTRRIVSLNLAGLLALVGGILYLSQFRAGLIDARAQSLLVQGEIIASAIAASATVETNAITIDPDRLLDLKTGESFGPPEELLSSLEFPINPEQVAPVLRRRRPSSPDFSSAH